MTNWCCLVALIAFACGDASVPVTRYISSDGKGFDSTLRHHAHAQSPHVLRGSFDPSTPAPAQYGDHHRIAWFQPNERGLARVATFDVWTTGYREPGAQFVTPCRIQIGPNPVRRPISIDFLFELFEDRELGASIREAVGAVDVEHDYRVELQSEGFWIQLAQFPDRGTPNVELVIDGCRRIRADRKSRLTFQRLTFDRTESLEHVDDWRVVRNPMTGWPMVVE